MHILNQQLLKNYKYFSEKWRLTLITLCSSIFLFLLPNDFKIFVLASIGLLAIFFWLTKDLLVTFFSLSLLFSQFPEPGKFFSYQVLPIEFYSNVFLPNGLLGFYGLRVADLMIMGLLLKIYSEFRQKKATFNKPLKYLVILTVASWASYFLFSLIASTLLSFAPFSSTVHLLQYLEIIPIFLASIIILNKRRGIFFQLLIGIFLFQTVVSLLIVSTNQLSAFSTNRPQATSTTEENVFFRKRATGTFLHSNQFALIYSIIFAATIGHLHKKRTLLAQHYSIAYFILIVLSQSRTVWLTTGLAFALFISSYKHKLAKTILKLKRSSIISILALGVLMSTIIVPRLVNSRYFFSQGGGGQLRSDMITQSLKVSRTAPLFGHGVVNDIYQIWAQYPTGYIASFPSSVHNGYLQMVLESGLFATTAFFFPWYFVFRKTPKVIFHPKLSNITVIMIVTTISLYYLLHPYSGNIEFSFLGLGLAFSLNELYAKA